MAFTLAQIQAFRCIVRTGTFAAAAAELGVTQPSISQRIRELETTLGSPLFVRHGPRIHLTPQGRALIPHADRLVGVMDEVFEQFHARDPLRGLLRLGVTDSFALIALPDLLQRLGKHHPQLKTAVRVADVATMTRMLNQREIDLAIGPRAEVGPDIRQETLGTNVLAWFAATQFGIPHGVISAEELASHHLMIAAPPSRLHEMALDWFARLGVEPERVSTCNNLEVTSRAVLSGHAVGLIPVRVMRDHLAQGRVGRLTVLPPLAPMEFSICYHISESDAPVQAVVELSREVIASHELYI